MTDLRIVQLEGLVGGIVESIIVAFRAIGYYRTAIGDGVVGVIQQGGASNDNRGNLIAAGDGDLFAAAGIVFTRSDNLLVNYSLALHLEVEVRVSIINKGVNRFERQTLPNISMGILSNYFAFRPADINIAHIAAERNSSEIARGVLGREEGILNSYS